MREEVTRALVAKPRLSSIYRFAFSAFYTLQTNDVQHTLIVLLEVFTKNKYGKRDGVRLKICAGESHIPSFCTHKYDLTRISK